MQEKIVAYSLIVATGIIAGVSTSVIIEDFQDGPHSEFDLTGLGTLLVIACMLVYLALLMFAGALLKRFGKISLGKAVQRGCLISIPLLLVVTVGAVWISEMKALESHRGRLETKEAENRIAQQKRQELLSAIEKAFQSNPNDTWALTQRAELSYNSFEFDEAIAGYAKVLSLEPRNIEAHKGIARTFTALGRYDEAISHYQAAKAMAPSEAEALSNSIRMCEDLQRTRQEAAVNR